MNPMPKFDLQKALDLTKGGRLADALGALKDLGSHLPAAMGSPAALPRQPLPDVLRGVLDRMKTLVPATGLANVSPAGRPGPAPQPTGARFEERSFSNAAGSRAYKLYIPASYTGQVGVPLVVMLHGCTQSPDDFAAGTQMNLIAEERGFLVAYPAQTRAANSSKCWNWFEEGEQHRDRGEPSLIAGITMSVQREFAIDPARTFVAGLSAGGAAAAIMGAAYPELYTAIGVHSGLACGAARDMPSAFAAMRGGAVAAPLKRGAIVPTIVFHGDRDGTVSPVNGDQVIAQAAAGATLGASVSHGQSPGGMRYTRTVQADVSGVPRLEQWTLHGAGHAWSGGSTAGSYTEPRGPDASRAMVDFFLGTAAPVRRADALAAD